ncbi:MAG TPA: alpha/beta hydrolase [Lentimicrobium sp.]|nr:alpha/beta hydrolase [Lentimicrobium sp.]
MRLLLVILLILPFVGFSQKENIDFPRDTSFTVQSTFLKERKKYPFITIVEEFHSPNVIAQHDLVYYTFGNRKLHADVFYPSDTSKKHPGVILIHGGGWASGNKSHLVPLAQKLAANGFVATSVEYRLSPEAKYPAGVIDLKTAIRWFKQNGSKFNLDTTKIAVLGTSAGATLATLLGTTGGSSVFPSHLGFEGISDQVQSIVNMDGVLDFTDPAESGKDNDPKKPSAGARWFGYTFIEKPELWIEASPITYVNNHTPPIIFINSAQPRYHAGRDKYLDVLNRNGIYNEVHTIENTPHPYWLFHPWFDEAVPFIVSFLDKTLN